MPSNANESLLEAAGLIEIHRMWRFHTHTHARGAWAFRGNFVEFNVSIIDFSQVLGFFPVQKA